MNTRTEEEVEVAGGADGVHTGSSSALLPYFYIQWLKWSKLTALASMWLVYCEADLVASTERLKSFFAAAAAAAASAA